MQTAHIVNILSLSLSLHWLWHHMSSSSRPRFAMAH